MTLQNYFKKIKCEVSSINYKIIMTVNYSEGGGLYKLQLKMSTFLNKNCHVSIKYLVLIHTGCEMTVPPLQPHSQQLKKIYTYNAKI